jgi:hypothetical protein
MSFNFFGFGLKKTRKTRKTTRKTPKPDRSLIKLCKKYGIKVTKKSGSKRVYKKSAVLKKQCARKIRSIIKRKSKFGVRRRTSSTRGPRSSTRRPHSVPSMMVTGTSKPMTRIERLMAHLRRNRGRYIGGAAALTAAALAGRYARAEYKGRGGFRKQEGDEFSEGGALRQLKRDKSDIADAAKIAYLRAKHATVGAKKLNPGDFTAYQFQAARAEEQAKKSDKAREARAINALKNNPEIIKFLNKKAEKIRLRKLQEPLRTAAAAAAFGKRRRGRRGVGRYRFGNGGNPSLSSSMGYEFCSGGGGVLGANSTGLFPSPCMGTTMPMMGAGPAAAFGKRRRNRMKMEFD